MLAPRGQALLAMPLRGSFQEIGDLLREYALKTEQPDVTAMVDRATHVRPTAELLGAELEDAGFHYVDVEPRRQLLAFKNGRDFLEDPVTRLLILPELRSNLDLPSFDSAMAYVRDAIDRYWSDSAFELTVNVGCASGRKK